MIRHIGILLLSIGLHISLLTSCGTSDMQFSSFENLPENGWSYGDTVEIATSNIDSASLNRASVAVRHNDQYLYRNLWLEVSYCDIANRLHRDTVNIEMADEYGRWTGKGIGASYQCEANLPHITSIPDSSRVCIRHIMRVDTLRGIEQVGIAISDYKP